MPDPSMLKWRCRRGTKELDTLTTRYLDNFYHTANESEQRAFADLLLMQDPELHAILTNTTEIHDPAILSIVNKIHSI